LADHSLKYPLGIFEDVLMKVGDLYIPVDFVILEIEENTRTPIILRRPFLATVGCRIDVKIHYLLMWEMIMWSLIYEKLLSSLPFLMSVIRLMWLMVYMGNCV